MYLVKDTTSKKINLLIRQQSYIVISKTAFAALTVEGGVVLCSRPGGTGIPK